MIVQKNSAYTVFFVLMFLAGFFFPCQALSSKVENENLPVVPADAIEELNQLLTLLQPGKDRFDPLQIENIMGFVLSDQQADTRYQMGKVMGMPSAYYAFDIKTDLKMLLQYCYNTNIPSAIFSPSSIRMASWSSINSGKTPLPSFWTSVGDPKPLPIIRAVEHIEITPDQFSGAYYQYDVNKALILCNYKGKNLFISIHRQNDVSEPGKKGVVIGPDEDWNYFYSGKKGLSIKGLGWANTYMYDSFSISFYYEPEPDSPVVLCAVFSGVKAGWSGINMVKNSHVYKGLQRYADGFKMVIEHPMLPAPSILEKTFTRLNDTPADTLKPHVKAYLNELGSKYRDEKSSWDKTGRLITSDDYLNQLSHEELQSILALEYIKKIVGKATASDVGTLYSRASTYN